jgi:thiol reductant ABC exporter CydC subunit
LAIAIVGVQFFCLSRGFCRYGERLVSHDAAFRVLAAVRSRLYRQLELLAPSGLPAFRSGDLLARLLGDVDSLQDSIVRVVPPFAIAMVVGALAVALEWWLLPAAGAVLLVALVASATAVPWVTGTLACRRESGQARARLELAAAMVDLIDGAPELTVYDAVPDVLATIDACDARLAAMATAGANTTGIGSASTTLLAGLASWGAVVVGVPAVVAGHLNGTLLAAVALVPLAAFELVAGLPTATRSLQAARRSAAQLFEVLDAPVVVVDPDQCADVPCGPHRLDGRDLSARYRSDASPAICGVDVDLPTGRRVAIVGPSGAGKSTFAAVLARFLSYEGSITLDEIELSQLRGDDVRTVVGLVAQDAHLFDAPLAANLRVARPDADDDDLRAALGQVGLAEWVDELPHGLETEVGRWGRRLSGGQRHRVALARALLAAAPILVLDEPAEHLDAHASDSLTADLLELTSGRSTIMITHRLAGLGRVDEVVVFDEGRVVERGTHDQLLDAGGRYSRLWEDERRTDRFVMLLDRSPSPGDDRLTSTGAGSTAEASMFGNGPTRTSATDR